MCPEDSGDPVTGHSNAVSLTVPPQQYTDVVRLVVGGFVSRMFGFEALDDIQLAVEAVVRSIPPDGTHVRVSLAHDDQWLTVAVGSFRPEEVERRLVEVVNDGIPLDSLLQRLVDTVEIVDGAAAGGRPAQAARGPGRMRPGSATETERRALLRAYREDGDTAARDRLIEDFLPLARSLARRYSPAVES